MRKVWIGPTRVGAVGLCLLALGVAQCALAMQPQAGAGKPAPAVGIARSTTTGVAGVGLVTGVPPGFVFGQVQAVELAQSRLKMNGRWVHWRKGHVRVYSMPDGSLRDVSSVQAGMSVRLALDPGVEPPTATLIQLGVQP